MCDLDKGRYPGTPYRHSFYRRLGRGPQRRRLGGVPGGVYDLSGLLV